VGTYVIFKILLRVGVLDLDEFYHLVLGPALTLLSEGVIVSIPEKTFLFSVLDLRLLNMKKRIRVC
jgi:hypothetical protein